MVIVGKFTKEIYKQLGIEEKNNEIDEKIHGILEYNHATLDTITNVFHVLDSNNVSYYIVSWKLNIGCTLKKNLISFDDFMRGRKQEYNISQINNNEKKTIIEYTYEHIKKDAEGTPLTIYMNEYIKKEDKNIVIQINNIKPHVMLYISNMINTLNNNNDIEYKDYIAILKERSIFYDVWEFLIKNDVKYIFKWKVDITEIPENILKQIEAFLQGVKVKYNIEKRFDDVILTVYPKNEEVIAFIEDVLDLNNISYIEDDSLDNTDLSETSLWIFPSLKEEKEKICEMLKKPDKNRINRLKELGAPQFIIENEESGPTKCTYGVITSNKLQNQIENILQSLKLNYSILNINEEIIKEYKDPKAINAD